MKTVVKAVFIVVQFLLYMINIQQSVTYMDEIHYTCILLCFAFAICAMFAVKWQSDKTWIVLGLCFTSIADYFLIIQNNKFFVGVYFFFLTQCCYFGYLTLELELQQRIKILGQRVAVSVVLFLCIAYAMRQMVSLVFLVILYMVFFIHNIILGIKRYLEMPLFVIGLMLFICCDICVGLSNASLFSVEFAYQDLAERLVWLFYMPSQVCISYYVSQKRT